jgi:hypothetical protein
VYYDGPGTATHELGHNLGLAHSGLITCDPAPISTSDRCQYIKYGDNYETMGGDGRDKHHSAFRVETMGWFRSGKVQQVNASGAYVLNTMHTASDGVVAITIPFKNIFSTNMNGEVKDMVHYSVELQASEDVSTASIQPTNHFIKRRYSFECTRRRRKGSTRLLHSWLIHSCENWLEKLVIYTQIQTKDL